MPPQQPNPTADTEPDRLYTPEEFAAHIRRAYPTLNAATDDDRKLTHVFLIVNPEFKSWVTEDVLEGSELAPPPFGQRMPYAGDVRRTGPPPSAIPAPAEPSFEGGPPPPPMSLRSFWKQPGEAMAATEQATQDWATEQARDRPGFEQRVRIPAITRAYEAQKRERDRRHRLGLPPQPTTRLSHGAVGPQQETIPSEPPPLEPLAQEVVNAAITPVTMPLEIGQGAYRVSTALGKALPLSPQITPSGEAPEQSTARELAGGTAQMVRGTIGLGTLAVPEAIYQQPLRVGVGLIAGTKTDQYLRQAGQALGIPDEYTDLIAVLGGLAVGVSAAHYTAGKEASYADRRAARERAGTFDPKADLADAAADWDRYHRDVVVEQQVAATRALYQKAQTNARLNAVQQMFQSRPGSAFDYLTQLQALGEAPTSLPLPEIMESFARVGPVTYPPAPPPLPDIDLNTRVGMDTLYGLSEADAARLPEKLWQKWVWFHDAEGVDPIGMERQATVARANEIRKQIARTPYSLTPPGPKLLPPAGPDFIGAPPGGIFEPTGPDYPGRPIITQWTEPTPSAPPVTSPATPPPSPLARLGDTLEDQLRTQRQPSATEQGIGQPSPALRTRLSLPPPPFTLTSPPTPITQERLPFERRTRLREQPTYLDAYRQSTERMASEMEEWIYEPGRLSRQAPEEEHYFTPPVGGSPIYHEIVGRDTVNPPSRNYITAIVRAFHDSGGARTGTKLDTMTLSRLRQALGLQTNGGARRAYDSWANEVHRVADQHARQELARMERRAGAAAEGEAADAGEAPPAPLPEPTEPGFVGETTPEETDEPGVSGARVSGPPGHLEGEGRIRLGGISPRGADIMGTALYEQRLYPTVARELLQNALDVDSKHVTVRMSPEIGTGAEPWIEVEDDGPGMTLDQLETVFSNLFESGKGEQVGASGGFGVAKAAPLKAAERFQVTSVVDEPSPDGGTVRMQHNWEGTSATVASEAGTERSSFRVGDDEPTGVIVRSFFKPGSVADYDAADVKNRLRNIAGHSVQIPQQLHIEEVGKAAKSVLPAPAGNLKELATRPAPYGESVLYRPKAVIDPGSYFTPSTGKYSPNTIEPRKRMAVHVLNNGRYAMTFESSSNVELQLPKAVVVDLKINVEEGKTGYPFTANRDRLQWEARDAIDKFVKETVMDPARAAFSAGVDKAFDTLPTLPASTAVFYDVGSRYTPEEATEIKQHPFIRAVGHIVQYGVKDLIERLYPAKATYVEKTGLILHDTLGGLNIRRSAPAAGGDPQLAIVINPFAVFFRDHPSTVTPEQYGEFLTHLILHETTHAEVRSEGAQFTFEEAVNIGKTKDIRREISSRIEQAARKFIYAQQQLTPQQSLFGGPAPALRPEFVDLHDRFLESRRRPPGQPDPLFDAQSDAIRSPAEPGGEGGAGEPGAGSVAEARRPGAGAGEPGEQPDERPAAAPVGAGEQQRTVTLYRWQAEPGTGVPDWVRDSSDYQASQQAAGSWYTDRPEDLEFYKQDSEGRGKVTEIRVTPEEADRMKIANNPQAAHTRFSADPEHEYFVPRDVREREEQAALPGAESVRTEERPTPTFEAPFSLTPETAEPSAPTTGKQPTLFERLKGEEGHLILNVSPSNHRGIREWLDRHQDEYGDSDWHQIATAAVARKDYSTAYRAMAIAVSHANAGSPQPPRTNPNEVRPLDPIVTKSRAEIEKQIGGPLPKYAKVSPQGVITFPSVLGGGPSPATPPLIKATATDLTLARVLVKDVLDAVDPTKIFEIAGNTDPNLRRNAQIADYIVRHMPADVLDPLLELTGAKDPVQLAKEFRRQASDAGRRLQLLQQFGVDHWDELQHLTLAGPSQEYATDVVGLSKQSPSAFHNWLHTTATQADLDNLGFHFPPKLRLKTADGEMTPEAKAYATRWLTRQRQMAEIGKTLDVLAKDGSDYDRALIAAAITPEELSRGGVFRAISDTRRAFLLTKTTNMLRNLATQEVRALFEVADDALAGVYSHAVGNHDKGNDYFKRAQLRLQGQYRKGAGASASLLKHPWLDSMEAVYNYKADAVEGLPATHAHKTLDLIRAVPPEQARFMGSTGYGEFGKGPAQSRVKAINALTDPGVRNTLLIGSRLQEHTFRVQSADAVMRAQLIEKGFDPEQHYPTKQEIVDKVGIDEFETMVGASVSASLNETFAASSIPGTAPDVLLDLFSRHPVFAPLLQAGLPFPRFAFVNAPRWIWQHNPFAPLIEGPTLGITNRFRGDILPALRGQRYFGQKRQSLEQTTIPGLDAEIGRATLQNAIALQNVFQARRDALDAATRFNAAIKAAEKSGTLPLDAHDEIAEASRQMTEAVARQTDQTAAYKALAQRVRNLGKQRKEARGQLQQLQEAGAPATAAEYYARLTTGAALLGAAYMLRSAPGQAKTKWNEWRYRQPDLPGLPGSGHTADVDLTPYSPIVQFLLPMDIAHDVWTHTDWKAARTAFQDGGSNYDSLVDAMHTYYTGKYTQSEIWKEAAQSYLTYSPAAGTSRDLLDLITGRTSGSSDIAETIPDAVLATIGQWIGGFTTPLQQINEIEGQFRPEAAKARIPAMGTEEQSQRFQELLGPTLANIPHVREHLVPEKISPLTGKAVQTIDPLARFGAGLTQRERSRFEEEINVTGFPYGQLVPRQMGDRAFDNVVAKHYYQMLKEYLEPELLDDPEYQELTPELKRDRINGMLNGLKKAAYYEAGEEMGLDDEATFQKVEPKGTREKRERWIRWMDQLNKEADRDHPQAPEPQQQEPGGPPPGLGGGAAGGPPPPL